MTDENKNGRTEIEQTVQGYMAFSDHVQQWDFEWTGQAVEFPKPTVDPVVSIWINNKLETNHKLEPFMIICRKCGCKFDANTVSGEHCAKCKPDEKLAVEKKSDREAESKIKTAGTSERKLDSKTQPCRVQDCEFWSVPNGNGHCTVCHKRLDLGIKPKNDSAPADEFLVGFVKRPHVSAIPPVPRIDLSLGAPTYEIPAADIEFRCTLEVGDKIDVLDSENMWNIATILAVSEYRGWLFVTPDEWNGDEYDYWVARCGPRIARPHTKSKTRLAYQYEDIRGNVTSTCITNQRPPGIIPDKQPGASLSCITETCIGIVGGLYALVAFAGDPIREFKNSKTVIKTEKLRAWHAAINSGLVEKLGISDEKVYMEYVLNLNTACSSLELEALARFYKCEMLVCDFDKCAIYPHGTGRMHNKRIYLVRSKTHVALLQYCDMRELSHSQIVFHASDNTISELVKSKINDLRRDYLTATQGSHDKDSFDWIGDEYLNPSKLVTTIEFEKTWKPMRTYVGKNGTIMTSLRYTILSTGSDVDAKQRTVSEYIVPETKSTDVLPRSKLEIDMSELSLVDFVKMMPFRVTGRYRGAAICTEKLSALQIGTDAQCIKCLEIWSELRHPSIVQLLGFAREGCGYFSIVTNYESRADLDMYLLQETPPKNISLVVKLQILLGVASALMHIHSKGFAHGYVNAHSVVLDEKFQSKLGRLYAVHPFDRFKSRDARTEDVYDFGILTARLFEKQRKPGLSTESDFGKEFPIAINKLVYRCCEILPSVRPSMVVVVGILLSTIQACELEQKETKNETKTAAECVVCYERPVKVAFGPCGHLHCCKDCADKLSKCPTCRAVIATRLDVFL